MTDELTAKATKLFGNRIGLYFVVSADGLRDLVIQRDINVLADTAVEVNMHARDARVVPFKITLEEVTGPERVEFDNRYSTGMGSKLGEERSKKILFLIEDELGVSHVDDTDIYSDYHSGDVSSRLIRMMIDAPTDEMIKGVHMAANLDERRMGLINRYREIAGSLGYYTDDNPYD